MSEQEIDKVIKELRAKTQSIEFTKKIKKIDKKAAWELAKKVGKSFSDDSLSAPHPSRA